MSLPALRVIGPALVAFAAAVLASPPALAYVGPGAGLTAIGTLVAVVAVLVLAVAGFVWYPLKRLMRKNRPADRPDAPR